MNFSNELGLEFIVELVVGFGVRLAKGYWSRVRVVCKMHLLAHTLGLKAEQRLGQARATIVYLLSNRRVRFARRL